MDCENKRSIRPGWEAKLGLEDVVPPTLPATQYLDQMILLEPFAVDFTNNDWLTDFFLAPNH